MKLIGEAEPRRSVRATKGQHTKSFDELEPAVAPKRRQTKKTKKAQEKDQSQEPEEVIRCVCGATEQDEDSGEAWISCETCYAWQHNVCVGVSSFEDEIPENYWCEQCRPEDHKELLAGIAKGEKPWEARRKAHEEEEAERKKKKGGRKGKGKRTSDSKDELDKDGKAKAKPSPAPEPASKDRKEPAAKQTKRKSREESQDTDGKSAKLRRVSERDTATGASKYTKPDDLAASISELAPPRSGPAKALKKSISHVLAAIVKDGELKIPEGSTEDSVSEEYALQIERAVFDTHPASKGQKEYNQQIKSLTFNLKNNPEVMHGLLHGVHSPATLAVMTSEQLASAELQKQTAEMRAKAEKQSILYTQETGPRVRRTHKGEEVVEDETALNDAPLPMAGGPRKGDNQHPPLVKRESTGGDHVDLKARSPSLSTAQHSPTQSNFDINKVFSTVKSPTLSQNRRPSAPVLNTNGPGFDPDVDRMLQDETESPPYSPTEESHDPDVVWKGSLAMSSIADFQATAKHVGGANFSSFGPWSKLIPKRMTVAGRIPQQSAIEYLCSLRYSNLTDIVVVSIIPTSAESQQEFKSLVDYFISKGRYGVVGNKVAGNVRDTYLVPVPAGDDGHPEFMLNLVDNYIPKTRTEPMLLAVFVYRNEPDQLKQGKDELTPTPTPQPPSVTASPTPGPGGQRSNSMSGPAFSPATPQGPFGQPHHGGPPQSTTPVPIPQPPHMQRPPPQTAVPPPSHSPAPGGGPMTEAQKYQAQQAGQATAAQVLGEFISVPTVQFLLPQAFQMSRREWEVIKSIYEKDPRARQDLQYLGALLEKEGSEKRAQGNAAIGAPS
ncbi:PHD finger domain-containing protein [Pochonia chlamydosporia 170]|uniref:Transcription factor BYE1 n=1 Tax=Pochonia chlamydosporia 170 TaxID=1380566 RepID=A0A179GA65_METCM|nr:PHD finger domain-containing protein [Pochonia chlamydosporia 170]OAQ74273.1 PHD finger domain-containing protein [Pochonia chlamydosporia 170]